MRGVFEKVKGSKDFYIRYTDERGQRHREHVGRESAAVEALVNRRREVREGRFIPPHSEIRVTFAELAEKMLTDKAMEAAVNTIAGNRRHLRRLLPLFGNIAAKDVTTAKVNEVLRELKFTANRPRIPKRAPGCDTLTPGQISGPSLNGYRFFLSSIFTYGIDNGHIEKNPVRKAKKFEKHEGIIRYLTADEETALRAVIRQERPEFLPELDLALNTGLRKHEQRLLTWDKIDLERGILTVPSETKTGRRFIPINSVCRQAIEELHVISKGAPQVCPWNWRSKGEWLQKWLAKAKVMNFRWHDLRHTFASRLVMAGVDLRQVQLFMGHSLIETTMKYAHLSPEHGKAAIERLVPAAVPAPSKRVRRIA
jgi:site-specific recombinase XerD